MAEKVVDKLKRISRDLADSVRAEIDLSQSVNALGSEIRHLKECIECYVSDKEGVGSKEEAISFIKGYHKAKIDIKEKQLQFKFEKK